MKWLLSLLLGASLAFAQKKCLANFHKEEKGRCELYGEQAGLSMVIDDTQNVVGKCADLKRPRAVILKRQDLRDTSLVFTTINPKQSYEHMIKFLTSQSVQIDSKHKFTLTYNYKTRDGKARAMTVKSDMDLWAAFLLQGRYSNVELTVSIFTEGPTAVPTTATPTSAPTTAAPTAFSSGILTNKEDMDWLQKELKDRVKCRMYGQTTYRMSRDGKASSYWFSKTQNRGPFLYAMKTTRGNIFGAYVDISWTRSNSYFYCDNCFLWVLKGRESKYNKSILTQYRYQNYATYHHTSYGPCFGGAHDFCINSPTTPSGYGNFGYTYKSPTGGYPYYMDVSNSNGFKIAEWEIIPVVGIHEGGFFSYSITAEEDQKWLQSLLPTGKTMGYRCYRMMGLGKTSYGAMNRYRDACAGKGPLMVIIKDTQGYIFGAYTGISWCTNSCGYRSSSTAFLWILKSVKDTKKKLLQYRNQSYATYHNTSYGPCFGGGHDLCISNPSGRRGYGNVGHVYKMPQGNYPYYMTATNTANFSMSDWEVFVVVDKK